MHSVTTLYISSGIHIAMTDRRGRSTRANPQHSNGIPSAFTDTHNVWPSFQQDLHTFGQHFLTAINNAVDIATTAYASGGDNGEQDEAEEDEVDKEEAGPVEKPALRRKAVGKQKGLIVQSDIHGTSKIIST